MRYVSVAAVAIPYKEFAKKGYLIKQKPSACLSSWYRQRVFFKTYCHYLVRLIKCIMKKQ